MTPEDAEAIVVYGFDSLSCDEGEVVETRVGVESAEEGVQDIWESLVEYLVEANALKDWREVPEEKVEQMVDGCHTSYFRNRCDRDVHVHIVFVVLPVLCHAVICLSRGLWVRN